MLSAPLPHFVTLLDGLLAGIFIGSSMVEHAARVLGASFWIAYKQAKEAVFAPVMPVLFSLGLIVTAAAAPLQPEPWALAGATALMAVVLGITVRIHLPLNKRFQTWSPQSHPVTWDADRRRWRNWNLVRTALMCVAFLFVLTARA